MSTTTGTLQTTYPRRKQNRQTDFWETDLILTNNRRTSNRPIWLTKDVSKLTNDWWQTLHESFSPYHHSLTDQSFSTDQTYDNIDWQTLFTWLWRWLPLRLSKRQSPAKVLFRTTLTRTITRYELLILLGSNHLLCNILYTRDLFTAWTFTLICVCKTLIVDKKCWF